MITYIQNLFMLLLKLFCLPCVAYKLHDCFQKVPVSVLKVRFFYFQKCSQFSNTRSVHSKALPVPYTALRMSICCYFA